MLKWTLSEQKNINRERASLFITHTHSPGCMSESGEALSSEREREQPWRLSFLYLVFTASIGAHSISEEVTDFSLLWFP